MAKTRSAPPRKPRSPSRPRPAAPKPAHAPAIVGTEELGQRMRKVRLERRMTLKQVERAAELSATHLSEIERGRTSPTIGALVRIARALGRDTSYFIEREERSDVAHLSRDRAPRLQLSPGVEARVLTPGIPGSRLFAYRMTMTPGSGRAPEFTRPASEDADGEAMYVIRRGSVTGRFGDEEVTLRTGDGVQVGLGLPHKVRPASQEPVELLAIFTHPMEGGL